jgi:hypothetical protein
VLYRLWLFFNKHTTDGISCHMPNLGTFSYIAIGVYICKEAKIPSTIVFILTYQAVNDYLYLEPQC